MRVLKQNSHAHLSELPTDRYPGAQPFSDTHVDPLRFFGREEDTRALLHQLLGEDLLVLFAKPGLGKMSLLQASLFPRLREDEPGLLQDLTPEIPSILQHRFRLTGLSHEPGGTLGCRAGVGRHRLEVVG
jgi:hypothetical protein